MTLFARDPDTGVAKWAYQMTPFDEWDYDGINESILVDMKVKGADRKVLVHFDRNGFGYTRRSPHRRAAGRSALQHRSELVVGR